MKNVKGYYIYNVNGEKCGYFPSNNFQLCQMYCIVNNCTYKPIYE